MSTCILLLEVLKYHQYTLHILHWYKYKRAAKTNRQRERGSRGMPLRTPLASHHSETRILKRIIQICSGMTCGTELNGNFMHRDYRS